LLRVIGDGPRGFGSSDGACTWGDWLATWPWPEGFGVPHPRHGKDKEEAAGRLLAFRYRGDVRGRVSCPQPLALP